MTVKLRGLVYVGVTLAPGQTRHVVLPVTPRSFARWNTTTDGWDVPDGTYRLFAGTSSADLPLTASLRLASTKVAMSARTTSVDSPVA